QASVDCSYSPPLGHSNPLALLPLRLQRREAERQQVKEEQSEFFLAAFAREREAVEALLAEGALEEAAARLQALQKLLTGSVRFLAPYEVRQGQETVARLQGDLSARRQQLQPKKKFALPHPQERSGPGQRPAPRRARPGGPSRARPRPRRGRFGRAAAVRVQRAPGRGAGAGPRGAAARDVLLSELRGCRVRLRGNPNTLDCLLAMACQQLRTHLTSRAVIEACSEVSFAPYSWSYPGIERDFESSGLDRNSNNWNLVDDLTGWRLTSPSPNWSLIPEQERITCWD
uniref:Tubulin folding cofactor C n=1 Tax=Catharus ustulatus TaxID=91951 RepID=A0A8C3TMD8_CATUS